MRLWFVCFVILFGVAELYPWVQGVALPLPLMLGAGVLLAIASNTDYPSRKRPLPPNRAAAQPTVAAAPSQEDRPSNPQKSVQLPPLQSPQPQPQQRPISFTIRKPKGE